MRAILQNLAVPLFVGAVVLAACEDGQDEIVLGEYAEERAEAEEFQRAERAPGERPLPEVEVMFDGERLVLARDSVDAGPVVLLFTNLTNAVTTECTVEGAGRRWTTEGMRPRAGTTLDVVLQPGTYEIRCPIYVDELEDGDEQSVRATLTVR